MTTPITCAKCETPMEFHEREAVYVCPACGHKRYETLQEAQARKRDALGKMTQAPNLLRMSDRTKISHRALIYYEDAQAARMRGETAQALASFEKAIELEPDFLDAHFWAAKLTTDAKKKHDHLSVILAHDQGNVEALRELMVLDGKLTPEEAARTQQEGGSQIQRIDAPHVAQTDTLECPVCGGALTTDEQTGRVSCKFCGYNAPAPKREIGGEHLGVAMLERKAQPVRLIVGERIIHCNNCGAERTIPARQLSMLCMFCGSTHVVESAGKDTFTRPDGLIPFEVSEEQAKAIIRERLKDTTQRIASFFDDNRIANAQLIGMYLPYWMFDVIADISQTVRQKENRRDGWNYNAPPIYQNNRFQDAELGILVPAAQMPDRALLRRLGEFETGRMSAYEPELLARYPAQLYDIDFEKASLEVREIVSKQMRRRHTEQYSTQDTEVTVSVFTKSMSFSLLLVPVWIATLFERDGDVRTALVNGQTGECVFGKTVKKR